jgi:hypothetical protein
LNVTKIVEFNKGMREICGVFKILEANLYGVDYSLLLEGARFNSLEI